MNGHHHSTIQFVPTPICSLFLVDFNLTLTQLTSTLQENILIDDLYHF